MALQKAQSVVFDPSKLEHRAAVGAYMKRNAWGDSPIRFAHDPRFGSLVEEVRTKLLNWYISQEVPVFEPLLEKADKSMLIVRCLPGVSPEQRQTADK
jgi:hypothetical protein